MKTACNNSYSNVTYVNTDRHEQWKRVKRVTRVTISFFSCSGPGTGTIKWWRKRVATDHRPSKTSIMTGAPVGFFFFFLSEEADCRHSNACL